VAEAALMIVTSKAFDNGTACVAEQSVVLDEPIADAALRAFEANGTQFLSPEEQSKLARLLFTERGELRPESVGLSAPMLAERAAMTAKGACKVLGAMLDEVGPQAPLSAEILGPVLSFYRARDAAAARRRCKEVLDFGGAGHTLGLHAEDDGVVAQFSELP